MNITDQIDNAIRDYGVSEDAMRWAPDQPAPSRRMPEVLVHFEVDMREFVLAMEQAREASRRAAAAIGEGLGLAKLWTWIDETHDFQAAKRARLRRMHQMYRAKRGRQ
jgi:hypothetical protein